MSSAFAVLFNLAIQIQSDPNHATLTFHHDPDYVAVRTRLERAILQFVMLGEGMESHWRLLRIFCLNYIDRARPAVHEDAYFTERDRWFRESVTDAVRLHS